MKVITTAQELDNALIELRADAEKNGYDFFEFYLLGEQLIKQTATKYNVQTSFYNGLQGLFFDADINVKGLSLSRSFEFSELAEQAAAATKKEKLAIVERGEFEYNYIDTNGKLLSNEWFKSASYFYNGFAVVQRGYNQYNFIDRQGKLLSDEWFKSVDYFNKDGFARVQRKDSKWNFIGEDGKIISDEWFKSVEDFQ